MNSMLLFGDTETSAALRHEIPIAIMDALLFAETGGRKFVLTSMLERDRVLEALPGVEVLDLFELGFKELLEGGMTVLEAERETALRAVRQIGIAEAIVPGGFPLALGDQLRAAGVALTVDDDAIAARRRAKAGAELAGIRTAQRAAEAAMAAAAALLARASPNAAGELEVDGERLLAEGVRAVLRATCAEHGTRCPPDAIVTSAWQGTGHDPGTGPLPAGLPIAIDLWPRDEASACWADMTRTFVVGEPPARVLEHRDLVGTALEQAKAAIRPGVTARAVFEVVCDLFEAAGHLTQRTATRDGEQEGFQYALGHGVGLEVHESPWVGLGGRDPLVAGDVLALEPGLWYPDIGEVRYEDLVLVTEDGCETLTDYPYRLKPGSTDHRG
jgi:Xaa-Pro aminopeptidase